MAETLSRASFPVLVGLAVVLLAVASPVFAVGYSITVRADQPSYSAAQPIHISGAVTPAPGPNTAVILQIKNPNGTTVDVGYASVDPTSGAYAYTSIPGGTANWVVGTYSVNATWGGNGVAISNTTAFAYSPTAATTSTTTTTSPVPEFNSQAILVVSLFAIGFVALLGGRLPYGRKNK